MIHALDTKGDQCNLKTFFVFLLILWWGSPPRFRLSLRWRSPSRFWMSLRWRSPFRFGLSFWWGGPSWFSFLLWWRSSGSIFSFRWWCPRFAYSNCKIILNIYQFSIFNIISDFTNLKQLVSCEILGTYSYFISHASFKLLFVKKINKELFLLEIHLVTFKPLKIKPQSNTN